MTETLKCTLCVPCASLLHYYQALFLEYVYTIIHCDRQPNKFHQMPFNVGEGGPAFPEPPKSSTIDLHLLPEECIIGATP